MTQAIFDDRQFMQSLSNDEELAKELLGAFLEDSIKRKESLGKALDAGDASTASKLAHSLKGMCGVVRAGSLVNLAYAMETSSKNDDLSSTREQYVQFTEALEKGYAEMRAFMSK